MYKSPIEIITENVKKTVDDNVYKAVTQYGFEVDRDELLKALSYDRNQYEKGFRDGYEARDSEIIHCRECGHLTFSDCYGECRVHLRIVNADDYCSCGKRKTEEWER